MTALCSNPCGGSLFQSGVEIPAWSGSVTSSIISCPSHVSIPLASLVFARHTPASGMLPILFPLPGKFLSHLSGFPQVSSSLRCLTPLFNTAAYTPKSPLSYLYFSVLQNLPLYIIIFVNCIMYILFLLQYKFHQGWDHVCFYPKCLGIVHHI